MFISSGIISPWLLILFPFVMLIIITLLNYFKRNKSANFMVLITPVIVSLLVINYYPALLKGRELIFNVFKFNSSFEMTFKVDAVGFLFAIISASLWIFTIIYSMGYMKDFSNKRRYYFFLILSLAMAMGIAFSNNLLTFYTFYELLTLVTYPLVIHLQTSEAMRAGKKYLVYSLGGAALILTGIIFMVSLSGGTSNFTAGGSIVKDLVSSNLTSFNIVLFLFLAGFSVKAAVMPFHSWLPTAMVAPTPISALFHAVAVVNSGVFGVLRVVYFIFGQDIVSILWSGNLFLILVLITIVLASIIALFQDNLKKRLAYSTISQLGYISLGILLLNKVGAAGGILHIFNHALIKITLFFCAGIIYIVTGKKNISQMAGLGKKMPLTMGAFAIATLGMVGIPPSVGFNSKWFLLSGSFDNNSILIMGLLLLSALLNAAYFFPIVITAFFKEPVADFVEHDGYGEAPLSMLVPVIILALGTIIFGVWYDFPQSIVRLALKNIF